MYFNQIDEKRHTAIYVRISTAMQKTDRQVEELVAFAKSNRLNFDESTDIYKDIISGFKDGEDRPNFSILMAKLEMGEYTQVLFSEFSRLERKPTNLLRDLEKFQSLGVYAWFSKQNLWVRDDKDLGTQIMIHILAVMSQYEIELFAARGIDGKISSMKNRGAYYGGPCPYGYTISPGTGKLAINPEEAEVVRTIFEKFSKGEKTAAIADWLNASCIPCSFRTRIAAANQRRINKGITPAKYKRGNVDNMIWRTTTVNRIVKNKVYIGVQHHKFHEPDPSNPLPSRKRKNRVLLTEFDVKTPHTRIIDDELFFRVNIIFEERAFNRNQSIRHGNLLKTLLRCGECGSRFCAVTLPMGRSYKCAGRTGVCKVKCNAGASVLMSKLDGLVLKLCIDKFAKYDLQQKAKGIIQKLDTGIEEKTRMFNEYSARQKEATENYTTVLKRAIRYARDEAEADALVAEAKEDYDRVSAECAKSLERIKAELDGLKHLRRSLSDIRDTQTLSKKSDEIMSDCSLVKDYIHEYVTDIVLYKPDESWVLVIVHFVDGSERWGTIKNERYKKSELRQDDLFDKVKYTGWLVNNDSHRFHYDNERRLFSELKYGKAIGEYSFAAFGELVKNKGMLGEFAPYDFK